MKKIKIDITTGMIILTIITLSINYYLKNFSYEKEYFNQNYFINIANETYNNNIEESKEITNIEKEIIIDCNNTKDCEINNIFDYVKNIQYVENNTKKVKYPLEVIESGGDCDEKSFLLASLLKVKNYKTILIICKNKGQKHMFVAINEDNKKEKNLAYIEIKNKKYYIAESTNKEFYVGAYNGIDKNDYLGIYDVNEKKNINLTDVKLFKNI